MDLGENIPAEALVGVVAAKATTLPTMKLRRDELSSIGLMLIVLNLPSGNFGNGLRERRCEPILAL